MIDWLTRHDQATVQRRINESSCSKIHGGRITDDGENVGKFQKTSVLPSFRRLTTRVVRGSGEIHHIKLSDQQKFPVVEVSN
jgi:hypothetical protein